MHLIQTLTFGLGLAIYASRGVGGATLWHNQDQELSVSATYHDSHSADSAQSKVSDSPPPSSPQTPQINAMNNLVTGGGCYRERCWTWCDFSHEMWCYTTQGTTWDGKHVECGADYECEEDWACAEKCRHKEDRD